MSHYRNGLRQRLAPQLLTVIAIAACALLVRAQVLGDPPKQIVVTTQIAPEPPCRSHSPCWLTKKGAALIDPTNVSDPSLLEAYKYYKNINAFQDSPTLQQFKNKNKFAGTGAIADVHAYYFNNGDLQLGREMHCNQQNANQPNMRIACYVSNYGPKPFPVGSLDNNVTYPNSAQALAELQTVATNGSSAANPHPFATVAMESVPPAPPPAIAVVNESDGVTSTPNPNPPKNCAANYSGNNAPSQKDVDTGVDIESGDIITFSASGQIWDGYCFIGNNDADGLGWTEDNDDSYPLPTAHEGALIGSVGHQGGPYFAIGKNLDYQYQGRPGRLYLRTNDNNPGNGNGFFQVFITVKRERTRFYVYTQNANHPQEDDLALFAALDEEGAKSFPQMCMACHGGDYEATQHMAKGASFLPFDVFSFLYSAQSGLTLDDQQEQFRQLNQIVRATNPNPDDPTHPFHPDPAIRNLIDALYGGHADIAHTKAVVPPAPAGWIGHEATYTNLYAHFCRTCHSSLTDQSEQSRGLDFEDFHIFQSAGGVSDICGGFMPHAEVPYKALAVARFDSVTASDLRALGVTCTKAFIPIPLPIPK